MSIVPDLSLLERWLLGHGLRGGGEEPPPPTGFPSWDVYFSLLGVNPLADYLPLGPPAPEGAKVTLQWARTGDDVAVTSFHFVHRAEGTDTSAWVNDDDSATIEALLADFWSAIRGHYGADFGLDRYRWHHFGVGVRRPNPAFRETVDVTPLLGTNTDPQLPQQVACAITQRTTRRRSWGRSYLPAPVEGYTDDSGLWIHDFVDDMRTAAGTLLDGAESAGLPMVVWCPRHDGKLLEYGDHPIPPATQSPHELGLDEPDTSSLARGVGSVQVDDVPDVIRRRRPKKSTYKQTHTVGA